MFDYICFDVETGGLHSDLNPITEFAMIVYDNVKFEEKFRFECFVKPYDELIYDSAALKHTGITMEMIKQGETVDDLVSLLCDIFKQFTYGSSKFKYRPVLVGHNIAKFDIPFIEYIFKRKKLNLYDFIEHYKEDTLFLGRTKWAGKINKFNLGACCKEAGIDLIDAHRAMNDVEANKLLHEFLIKSLRNEGNSISVSNKEESVRKTFRF